MFSFLKPHPFLDPTSADWIWDSFFWAMQCFDSNEFFQRSQLIQPSNEFFPGRVDSVQAKAENIFVHTLHHSGLSHWPFELRPPEHFQQTATPLLASLPISRMSGETKLLPLVAEHPIQLTYNPQQTLKPEDLAANFSHLLALHLITQAQQLPPGGQEFLTEAGELVAIFMGFGVLFANSAYTFRGGCGSCYNPQANRVASLSEHEAIFALAIFCDLKKIPTSDPTRYLKKHLKSAYKKALKQIKSEPEKLQRLHNFDNRSEE